MKAEENRSDFSGSFVETDCLFCGKSDHEVLYPASLSEESFSQYSFSARRKRKREHYRIVRCKNCSLVRSNPVISEPRLNELYAESRFIYPQEAVYAAKTYGDLFDRLVKKYSLRPESLMEIGCSNGFFLEKAKENGIDDVVGFEPSRHCCRNAPETLKSSIINDVFRPELLHGKKFDVACSFHVIDHLRNPLSAARDVRSTLGKDGHLLLVCHDIESWSMKILGKYSPVIDVEHIYLFSRATISMLLRKAGFRVLEVGSLKNSYPLGYWMQMAPVAKELLGLVPGFIRRIPVALKAGNLYAFGRKVEQSC